jgi:plastocyanin
MKTTTIRISLIAALLGMMAGANAQSPADAPYRATVDADGVQRVEFTGGDYFFKPRHVIVKARVPVELIVRVEPGLAPHRLVLKAPEAGIDIDEEMTREPKRYTFTPTRAGRYGFHCPNRLLLFKSHRERGMEGILEVVEP